MNDRTIADQRAKFDTLFTDRGHYRGDCRLIRTAIRNGWLDDAPQADRDALMARFTEAIREREAAGFKSESEESRAIIAQAWVMLEVMDKPIREISSALRYCWEGDRWNEAGRTTGRPRECWHISERRSRIDANAFRWDRKAEGKDLKTLGAIIVEYGDVRERVELAVVPDARYSWRVWLLCPRCRSRRLHLYPARAGVRCRKCARIGYASHQARTKAASGTRL